MHRADKNFFQLLFAEHEFTQKPNVVFTAVVDQPEVDPGSSFPCNSTQFIKEVETLLDPNPNLPKFQPQNQLLSPKVEPVELERDTVRGISIDSNSSVQSGKRFHFTIADDEDTTNDSINHG
jgi:hypothetical protein